MTVPTTATFTQLRHIDQQQQEIDSQADRASMEPDFVQIRCRLNGGMIPLELHLGDLRESLGLPAYSLRPPYRAPIDTVPPTENMVDVDHIDSPVHE